MLSQEIVLLLETTTGLICINDVAGFFKNSDYDLRPSSLQLYCIKFIRLSIFYYILIAQNDVIIRGPRKAVTLK